MRRRRGSPHLAAQRRLEHIARGLRSGMSLTLALDSASRSGPDRNDDDPVDRLLERLVNHTRRGASLDEALRSAEVEQSSLGALAVHRCLTVAAEQHITPEGAIRIVELGAKLAADRHAVSEERRAHSAQARLSATVLTWVPAIVAVVTLTVDAQVRNFSLGSAVGRFCLVAGTAALVAGHRWIDSIVAAP
jgi:Flp pilus assembly protein TadB